MAVQLSGRRWLLDQARIKRLSGAGCRAFGAIVHEHIGAALFADGLVDKPDSRLPHIGEGPH